MAKDRNRAYRVREKHEGLWTGLVLVIIGGALLTQKMGIDTPPWLFTWPMILVLVGLITGFKHGFRNPAWLILIGVGVFFLADDFIPDLRFRHYFWPVMIIGLGLLFMLRPKKKWHYPKEMDKWGDIPAPGTAGPQTGNTSTDAYREMPPEDMLDSVSIFGGVKKVVTSKNFKGGDIVCFMGGAEINLSQADIQGPATIELFQAFGGTKLVVPPHWEVKSEAIAIFAGIEDKRPPQPGVFDPTKVLILKGTTIFGGIEIKSY
jgi:predicted membrane protein